jgi:hypothetical protein
MILLPTPIMHHNDYFSELEGLGNVLNVMAFMI